MLPIATTLLLLFTIFIPSFASPTTTPTVGASTTSVCASPLPTFVLQLEKSGIVLNGIKLDGTYANLDNGDGDLIGFNGDNRTEAVVLSLNTQGNLMIDKLKYIGYTDPGQQMELMHFGTVAEVHSSEDPAVCSVATGQLKCQTGYGINVLQLCPGAGATDDVYVGASLKSGCVSPKFVVVPVCTVPGS